MFFKPINLQIDAVKVNNLDHYGSISFGNNEKVGRNVNGKKTQGFGQQMADYTLQAYNMSYSIDEDAFDFDTVKKNK